MQYQVEVGHEDISNATRGDARRCPVAIAFRRTIREKHIALQPYETVQVYDFGKGQVGAIVGATFEFPEAAADFVRRFDKGLPVEPFSFTLEFPEAAV